jgi:hypothetical protein
MPILTRIWKQGSLIQLLLFCLWESVLFWFYAAPNRKLVGFQQSQQEDFAFCNLL